MIIPLLLILLQQQIIPPPSPNVLLIILDDVGQQDIDEINTPSIDQLAQNGITMTRGYAQPVCAVARYALMFGKYGESAGSVCTMDMDTPDINWNSLPKLFKFAQYNTGIFGKWHLGVNSLSEPWPMTPNLYGYDTAKAIVPSNLENDICQAGFNGDYSHWLRVDNGKTSIDIHYNTIAIRNQFMQWWSNTKGPKFAYVSFQAAHSPFNDPPASILPYLPNGGPGYTQNRIQFEKMIISLDYVIGQFASIVSLDNTYIILIGDNGTPPNARSPQEPPDRYKTTVYEGGLRVPFIIAGPGISHGIYSNSLVNVVDILPTLADLIGFNCPVQDGISFTPILNNPLAVTRDHIFASFDKKRAIILNQYKLIRNDTVEEFYDILADPYEQNKINPSLIDPIIVQNLRDKMNIYIGRGF